MYNRFVVLPDADMIKTPHRYLSKRITAGVLTTIKELTTRDEICFGSQLFPVNSVQRDV